MKRRKKINKVNIHENITKSKSLIKLLIGVLVILLIGVGVIIFQHVNNLYVDVNKAEEDKIVEAINTYVTKRCDEEKPSPYSKCFTANKVYLVERIIDNDGDLAKEYKGYDNFYYAYSWIVDGTYYKENNEIKEDSGGSVPNKVLLGKKTDKYTVLKTQIPGDGTQYPEDMKKLFPSRIRNKMNNAPVDGTAKKLIEETEEKAKEYFK
jgi:hypothetical protein